MGKGGDLSNNSIVGKGVKYFTIVMELQSITYIISLSISAIKMNAYISPSLQKENDFPRACYHAPVFILVYLIRI